MVELLAKEVNSISDDVGLFVAPKTWSHE